VNIRIGFLLCLFENACTFHQRLTFMPLPLVIKEQVSSSDMLSDSDDYYEDSDPEVVVSRPCYFKSNTRYLPFEPEQDDIYCEFHGCCGYEINTESYSDFFPRKEDEEEKLIREEDDLFKEYPDLPGFVILREISDPQVSSFSCGQWGWKLDPTLKGPTEDRPLTPMSTPTPTPTPTPPPSPITRPVSPVLAPPVSIWNTQSTTTTGNNKKQLTMEEIQQEERLLQEERARPRPPPPQEQHFVTTNTRHQNQRPSRSSSSSSSSAPRRLLTLQKPDHDRRNDDRRQSQQYEDRRNQTHAQKTEERPRLLVNPSSSTTPPSYRSLNQCVTPAARTQAPVVSASVSVQRKDLLCFNKKGHDTSCSLCHDLESWSPKTCRFQQACKRISQCTFWHKEMETKKEFIKRSLNLKNTFINKHKKEFSKLYLS
jgi:hypothetical protein